MNAKRTRILGIVLGGLAFLCLLGVAARLWIGHQQRTRALRWYRPASEAPADVQWQELDAARIHRVLKDKQPEAIERLEEAAAIELTAEQAAAYTGAPLPDVPGAKPYLVRSLVKFLPGAFNVYVADGHLEISHGSLGRGPMDVRRHAIVLQLDRKPDEVYASASSAQ